MESLFTLLQSYTPPKKARVLNERQELIKRICHELGIENKYEKGIYFTLLTNKELEDEWQRARTWKVNPSALFNKNIRRINKEIKERIS